VPTYVAGFATNQIMIVSYLFLYFIIHIVSSLTGGSILTVKVSRTDVKKKEKSRFFFVAKKRHFRREGGVGMIEADFDSVPARFGIPDYNGNREGNITYLGSMSESFYGCDPYPSNIRWTPEQNMIVMVDRGNCYFVDKVDNAEEAGAIAVIVVESRPGRVAIMSPPKEFAHNKVVIPAVSISLADGNSIRQLLFSSPIPDNREASIFWEAPLTNGKVNFELYTTSNDAESQDFKNNLGEIVQQLVMEEKLDFMVRYYIFNGTSYGCKGSYASCRSQCLNLGRYCAEDPDVLLEQGVSGSDNVYEDLRAICVWNFTQDHDHGAFNEVDIWFEYVSRFNEECLVTEHKRGHENQELCATQQLQLVEAQFGISRNVLVNYASDCIANSGPLGPNVDEENPLLEEVILYREQMGIYMEPSFTVNGYEMAGSWHCPERPSKDNCNVFRAICAAYMDGAKPSLCYNDFGCAAGKYRDECGYCVLTSPLELDEDGEPSCKYDTNGEIVPKAGVKYPTWAPTENSPVDTIEEELSAGAEVAIIITCLAVIIFGCSIVFIYYIFKRNQAIRHERLIEEQGYLQTTASSNRAEDGKVEPMDAQTNNFFKQNFDFGHEGSTGSASTSQFTNNGLIEDSVPPTYDQVVVVEDDAP